MSDRRQPRKAIQRLVLATVLWGVSFPTMKALAMTQQQMVGLDVSWFIASLGTVYRFGIAALVLLLLSARTLKSMTRLELSQGSGLGLFGGAGILLQMDGLAHTSASTSAFLTQCYCLFVPLWVAARSRRWPPPRVFLSCALVMAGVAALAKVDWQDFRLGRGELETMGASMFFTGQILWLERPKYAANNVDHITLLMFAVMTLLALPVAAATTPRAGHWLELYSTAPSLGFLGMLVLFCTLGAYRLMNRWQRHVGATQAGLIYCAEPVFASAFALCLPAWFSEWAAIQYPNETLTGSLLLGGAFITVANIIIQLPAAQTGSIIGTSGMLVSEAGSRSSLSKKE